MKQSQFYYLLRRGLLKGASIVKEGLVMFNKFTTAGISHPAQGSAEFDGSSDYIQLNTPFSYTNHTIAAWVYANDTGGGKFIFDNRDTANDGIALRMSAAEVPVYNVGSAAALVGNASFLDEWVFVTATYDGTTSKLYTNGSLDQSATPTQTIDVNSDSRIGAQNYSITDYMNGNLANVAIWNRALSSDEINAVMWKGYDALEASEKSGLQAWYSLDDVASPAASLATMEALAVDKDATIENKAAITAAINALS
jgi:hypothetical protein